MHSFLSIFFLTVICNIFLVCHSYRSGTVNFPCKIQYCCFYRLRTTHNGHGRSINFRSSCDIYIFFKKYILLIYDNRVLQTLPFAILQESSISLTRQQAWSGLWRSRHKKLTKRLPSKLGSTYCYAYPNTILMHAKQ